MTYTEKKAIADDYISSKLGEIKLSDLCNPKVLEICDTEEDVFQMCNQVITEAGFEL